MFGRKIRAFHDAPTRQESGLGPSSNWWGRFGRTPASRGFYFNIWVYVVVCFLLITWVRTWSQQGSSWESPSPSP